MAVTEASPPTEQPVKLGWAHRFFARYTGGEDPFPLMILSALYFFDEFDTAALAVLAPNIRAAFDLTVAQFGLIVVLNLTIILLLAVPLGFYADRLPRRTFVWIGAFVAGTFSLLTGTAQIIAWFILFRLLNGFGILVNQGVHPSLFTDYYKPPDRPAVFGAHRNAENIGAIIGPAVAGTVAALSSWRVAFMILIVPIVICGILAMRLREPIRGRTDDPEAAAIASAERPPPFDRAIRTVMAVKTLRRQYLAWVFIGAAFIPLAYLLPLYLEREFGVEDFWRGVIGAANAAATFAGVRVTVRLVPKWMGKGIGELLKMGGWVLVALGPGLLAVGLAPSLPVLVPVGLVVSFIGGMFAVPFVVVLTFVAPARVRTLALNLGLSFLIAGAWLLYFIPGIAQVADRVNIHTALIYTTPYWVIGGLILRSGHKFVQDDASRAIETLQVAARIRQERLSLSSDLLLTVRSLDVAYDQTQVLFGVNFDVREGELVALLGTNGAGKSTLLKAISGLVAPSAGAVFFDGEDITYVDPEESSELGIIQMPGGKAIFPTLSVKENLDMALWMYNKDRPYMDSAMERVLQTFPVLRERLEQQAGSLSGGEQQMLSLAQAFMAKPKLLMIDELSLGLAPVVVQHLMGIVEDINQQGTTIILVEQSVNVALTVARHAYFMEKGEIRFDGPTSELLKRGDILRSVFLEGTAAARSDSEREPAGTARKRRKR